MPLNGSGTFVPAGSSVYPAVTTTTISSTDFNALMADVVTALSTAIYKDGQSTPTANIPMGGFKLTGLGASTTAGDAIRYEQLFTTSAVTLLGAMNWVKGADIASAATVNLTTATGNAVHVTGTVTITAVTLGSGMWRLVIFDGALTLTHHASNNNLPGGVNITTVAGDRALYWSDGTTVYCVSYQPVTITGTGADVKAASPTITGTLTGTGLLDISGASAGQIKFPATQNPSADVNTLDDYEEGTWTPAIGGSATYTTQTGSYTKVGRLVTVYGTLTINSVGSGSANTISGLPFTVNNGAGQAAGSVSQWANLIAAPVFLAVVAVNNSTTLQLNGATGGAGTISAPFNALGNSASVTFSCTYFV